MHADVSIALGDPQLDREHQDMFRLALGLLQAPEGSERIALESLRAHAAAHFAQEDEDLRRVGGHNASCHLDEHAAVLKSLDDVHQTLSSPTDAPETGRRLAGQLAQALLDWLPEHVHQMDAGIASVRAQQRLGGMTVKFAPRPPL